MSSKALPAGPGRLGPGQRSPTNSRIGDRDQRNRGRNPVSQQPLSALLQLPNELLQAIAAYLIPNPPATTRFALRPAGSWELKDARAQWADWKAYHTHLQALSRTCGRMQAVAGPCQYHTIALASGTAVVRLFCLLVARPDVKAWIHNLSCLA